MKRIVPRRPIALVCAGFALSVAALASGFGPGGPSTNSIVVADCFDLVNVTQGFCATQNCYDTGCTYHYSCTNGSITIRVAGSTWASATPGATYSRDCTQCEASEDVFGNCQPTSACTTATWHFVRPKGKAPCVSCCF